MGFLRLYVYFSIIVMQYLPLHVYVKNIVCIIHDTVRNAISLRETNKIVFSNAIVAYNVHV